MATSLLFLAILVFAVRGFFLGFVGVIGKVLGLIAGYFIAISYRSDAAIWVTNNTTVNLPAMVTEIGCGIALFFLTLFIVGMLVNISAGILKKLIPPLKAILDKNSTGARVTGAISNGLLGAAVVLAGIWLYGMIGKNTVQPPQLQRVADTFGNTMFNAIAKTRTDFSLTEVTSLTPEISVPQDVIAPTPSNGNAVIVSESDPQKRLSIQSTHQKNVSSQSIKQDNNLQDTNLLQLLGNGQIQELLNNPQIRQLAIDRLKDNPQQLTEVINKTGITPEQIQQLLKKAAAPDNNLQ